MAEVTLVKTTDMELPDQDREVLRRVLFGHYLDGMSQEDKAAWAKFWTRIKNLGPGELIKFSFSIERNGKFHRKFFALLSVGFEAWEPGRKHKTYKGMPVKKDFEQFREDVTVLAGFYEQTFNLKNELTLRAKSISFANMGQVEFERLYSAVADVLLEHVLVTYKDRAELDDVVDRVLRFL